MGPLAAELAPAFTVLTYDRRGRGESTDTPPYAVEREVEDLQALVDAAGGSAFVYGSSGAVLGLHAAVRGLPSPRLRSSSRRCRRRPSCRPRARAEARRAGRGGRRGDAVEHFHTEIGVPAEITAGMREAPFWPPLEAVAHTLPYDCEITASLPVERLAAIDTPTLVIDSAESDGGLRTSSEVVADALPNGSHRRLPGEWHGVAPEVLAPALTEFFARA